MKFYDMTTQYTFSVPPRFTGLLLWAKSSLFVLFGLAIAFSLSAQEVNPRSCVNTFQNQTVSTYLSVLGCQTLDVQNVTVSGNGNLYLSAPAEITINGTFEVQLGGVLNIKNDQYSLVFDYTYDSAGNRSARQVDRIDAVNVESTLLQGSSGQ